MEKKQGKVQFKELEKEQIPNKKEKNRHNNDDNHGKPTKPLGKYYYSLITGVLFVTFGTMQLLVSLGLIESIGGTLNIPKDLIGSFILILLGLIFLYGVYELQQGILEGVAYTYVGIMLSLFFLGIYLLILLISILQLGISSNTDSIPDEIVNAFRPIIYLGLLAVLGFIIWRGKFSTKRISS